MAVTQNTYTGNGSTVLYSFTFPYLEESDIKVSLNGTLTTAYSLANATTVQFNTAPTNGAGIVIYRDTDNTALVAEFYPGSAVRAQDLNNNLTQGLYIAQESRNTADSAKTSATAATATANSAISQSTAAVNTANTASASATAAGTTANTASTNASNAVTIANTASTNATAAVITANNANTTANTASSNASAAVTTANTASGNISTAVTTADAASTNASAAVTTANTALSTANTASTNATTALNTANSATTTANTALSTADTANTNATSAISAVSSVVAFPPVAAVANIPTSPTNGQGVQVNNSTGIQSFTPLSGKPVGFVGDAGLNVKIQYTTTGSTWNWIGYAPNDSDSRYLKLSGGTLTGPVVLSGAPTVALNPATKGYTDAADATLTTAAANAQTTANAALPKAGGTMTGAITLAADPVAALQPATKQYTDAATSSLTTAVSAVQSTANAALPRSGGTMTGAITLAADPAAALQPATKQYTDTATSTLTTSVATAQTTANAALPKAGGTLTGNLNVPSINGGPLAGSRNRIINGDMRVDQRTDSAVNNSSIAYAVDRFESRIEQATAAMSMSTFTDGPPGFSKYLNHTVQNSTAPAAGNRVHLRQNIEGFNVADFLWGSASAQTATLSFWVRSSITGTYGVGFSNSDANRSYVGTYLISAANTWEYKTITVPGDTNGTWLNGNNVGIRVTFDLGSGSSFNAAANTWTAAEACRTSGCVSFQQQPNFSNFRITGVQLESGTVPTPFERRSIGQEIALCQRYFEASGYALNTTFTPVIHGYWATHKRVSPTLTLSGFTGTGGAVIVNASAPFTSWYQSTAHSALSGGKVTGNAEF